MLAANNDAPGATRSCCRTAGGAYRLTIANTGGGEDGEPEGDLDVTNDPLAIVHSGRGVATIDGNDLDRVIDAFTRTRPSSGSGHRWQSGR